MPTQIELIKKHNLKIRGHLGQHLLIDPNLQRKIVDLLELKPQDAVLEIGAGLGALTGEVLRRGVRVWAIEKEKSFIPILEQESAVYPKGRFHMIARDILETDLQKTFEEMGAAKRPVKVLGNLPYYITAPILFRLFDHPREISRAVLTVQKEVAQRMVAGPGTKDYGRLSLAVRYFTEARLAFSIPPSCFTPRPEVDSAVVVLDFHGKPAAGGRVHEKLLFHLIESAFRQRRKTLLHLLQRDRLLKTSRQELEEIFKARGWSGTVRGEELLLKDFISLARIFQTKARGFKAVL